LFGEVNPRDNDLFPLGVTPPPTKRLAYLIKRNGRVCDVDALPDQLLGFPARLEPS
jgi:hypothetical protein